MNVAERSPFAIATVMAGVFLLQGGNGLFQSFLALRMTIEDFPTTVIGLVVTGYPLGFLVSCLTAPSLIGAVGHIRAFAAFAAVLCCATLAFALWIDPVYWIVLRMLTGFAAAGLFMIGESWLNARTPTAMRGKVFAIYMTSEMTAVSAGQALLAFGDPWGPGLFMVAAALFSASLIPVTLTAAVAPRMRAVSRMGVADLYRVSPLGIIGCVAAGLVNTAVGGVGPVFATLVGLRISEVATFMGVVLFGGLLLQWPIGRLSDRMDRRRVLVGVTVLISALALAIAFFGPGRPALLYALGLVYGGLAYTVYPLCAAHANDFADRRQVVGVSAGLLLAWSMGSIVAPMAASLSMAALGPSGLFYYVAVVAAALAGYALWRMTRRAAVPTDLAAPFVATPQTTPAAAELHPRAEPRSDQPESDKE